MNTTLPFKHLFGICALLAVAIGHIGCAAEPFGRKWVEANLLFHEMDAVLIRCLIHAYNDPDLEEDAFPEHRAHLRLLQKRIERDTPPPLARHRSTWRALSNYSAVLQSILLTSPSDADQWTSAVNTLGDAYINYARAVDSLSNRHLIDYNMYADVYNHCDQNDACEMWVVLYDIIRNLADGWLLDSVYRETAIWRLKSLLGQDEYSSSLAYAWTVWRTLVQINHYGIENTAMIPNVHYNQVRRSIISTIQSHLLDYPDDLLARSQLAFVTAAPNISLPHSGRNSALWQLHQIGLIQADEGSKRDANIVYFPRRD